MKKALGIALVVVLVPLWLPICAWVLAKDTAWHMRDRIRYFIG